MKVNDLMSKNIIYATVDNTIEEVSSLMKTYDIGFVPVKKDNEYIGVITDRDLIIRAIAENKSVDMPIERFISTNIISVDSDDDIETALSTMSEYQIRRLLVEHKNKFVGILSLSDIFSVDLDCNVLEYIINIFMPEYEVMTDNEIDLPEAEIDEFEL